MEIMSFQVGLNLVTLVMCILTLTMATAALMPQLKQGLVLLRDGLMWTLMLAIILTVAFIGWSRLLEVHHVGRDEASEPARFRSITPPRLTNAAMENRSGGDPVVEFSTGSEFRQPETERQILARKETLTTSWEQRREHRTIGNLEPVSRSMRSN